MNEQQLLQRIADLERQVQARDEQIQALNTLAAHNHGFVLGVKAYLEDVRIDLSRAVITKQGMSATAKQVMDALTQIIDTIESDK